MRRPHLRPLFALAVVAVFVVGFLPMAEPPARVPLTPIAAVPRTLEVTGRISDLAWSPDGTRLAVAHDRLAVFRLDEGTLKEFPLKVSQAAWSPDGTALAVLQDGSARLVDPRDGSCRPLLQFSPVGPLRRGPYLRGLEWHPGGRRLALWDDDNTRELQFGSGPLLGAAFRTWTYWTAANLTAWESEMVITVPWVRYSPDGTRMALLCGNQFSETGKAPLYTRPLGRWPGILDHAPAPAGPPDLAFAIKDWGLVTRWAAWTCDSGSLVVEVSWYDPRAEDWSSRLLVADRELRQVRTLADRAVLIGCSPTRPEVAVLRDGEAVVLDLQGRKVCDGGEGDWSPDGRQLACLRGDRQVVTVPVHP